MSKPFAYICSISCAILFSSSIFAASTCNLSSCFSANDLTTDCIACALQAGSNELQSQTPPARCVDGSAPVQTTQGMFMCKNVAQGTAMLAAPTSAQPTNILENPPASAIIPKTATEAIEKKPYLPYPGLKTPKHIDLFQQ